MTVWGSLGTTIEMEWVSFPICPPTFLYYPSFYNSLKFTLFYQNLSLLTPEICFQSCISSIFLLYFLFWKYCRPQNGRYWIAKYAKPGWGSEWLKVAQATHVRAVTLRPWAGHRVQRIIMMMAMRMISPILRYCNNWCSHLNFCQLRLEAKIKGRKL